MGGKMKSVLITGVGTAGVNVGRKFIAEGYRVIFYDLLPRRVNFLDEVSDQWLFVQGDIADMPFMLETVRKHQVEGIVHTALPPRPVDRPDWVFKTSIEATQDIFEIARLENLKVIFISSNATYGYRLDPSPMTEDDKVPGGPDPYKHDMAMYVATKISSETMLELYHSIYNLDAVTVRTSWVYGRGDTHNFYAQCFLFHALHGKPINLPSGGDHVANYTFADDLANGIFRAYTVRPLKHRLFNISGGRLISARELGEAVMKVVPGSQIKLGPGEMEVGLGRPQRHHIQKGKMDISRAEKELGYKPTSLEEGLSKTVQWWRQQKRIPLVDPETIALSREYWEPHL
jgi:UDP-glucose 4-epimerase